VGLSDREQRILAEIERQFYEEDPALAHAVRNISRSTRLGVRLPIVGLVAGLAIIVWTFTLYTLVALAGFILMVVSAALLVSAMRARGYADGTEPPRPRKTSVRRTWPFGRG
jgi:hypothetical protein